MHAWLRVQAAVTCHENGKVSTPLPPVGTEAGKSSNEAETLLGARHRPIRLSFLHGCPDASEELGQHVALRLSDTWLRVMVGL